MSVDRSLIEIIKGCAYGDYKTALESLETAFQQRQKLAAEAYSNGNQEAIDAVMYINTLIKEALFLKESS